MTDKLNGTLTYIKDRTSVQTIIDHHIYHGTSLILFNGNINDFNFYNNFNIHSFNNLTERIIYDSLKEDIDYYFIFNYEFKANTYELISLLIKMNRTVILVDCDFSSVILTEHIKTDKILNPKTLLIRERVLNF